jgi:hypothetical protein
LGDGKIIITKSKLSLTLNIPFCPVEQNLLENELEGSTVRIP